MAKAASRRTQKSMRELMATTSLSGNNAAYAEQLYESYLKDPTSVLPTWQAYFEDLQQGKAYIPRPPQGISRAAVAQTAEPISPEIESTASLTKQGCVDALITAYRRFGHLSAATNPLDGAVQPDTRLQLSYHHLSDTDLAHTFETRGLLDQSQATLREILSALQGVYCASIGAEYSRITDDTEREYLRHGLEQRLPRQLFDADAKKTIMKQLVAAEGLEKYLGSRYPTQKRFSIEGGDALIPMLRALSEQARLREVQELVIGMPHRGRLNVLLNVLGQSPVELFREFEGTKDYGLTTGDVKYHQGFSSDIETQHGPIHLSLAFNPSHLEFINPVVLGSVRARQERAMQSNHQDPFDYALPILLHGDAAFAGQGIVMETLNMSQTRSYCVGGAIHIILNNQVGFTTSDPRDARSSTYCSDPAKMIDMPIFHVNGDDVEATIKVAMMALDYRMRFHKDVLIDLVCYRRHGHQEVDEPRATQPMMYRYIDQHPTVKEIYTQQLEKEKIGSQSDVDQWNLDYHESLDAGREVVGVAPQGFSKHYAAHWDPFLEKNWRSPIDTSVTRETLALLGERLSALPENFTLQRNVNLIMQARSQMYRGDKPLDWGCAEMLAYASLLNEGHHIRFSGEDSRRGTFFHRHAVLYDQNTGDAYEPLQHLANGQGAHMQIYDSLLSEAGALGFEYGYSTSDPHTLVLWEAQFGDFANGAQVIIDQFISSAWQKWNRLSGLMMLLPHGYEGMGPEHSSARLERYLQLSAQDNIQVFVPSTPAQIFHLLRRQLLRSYRRPLIVMTPKSLLRHRLATSQLEDLSDKQLQLLIPEQEHLDINKVDRVIACSGKVYYELLEKRRKENIDSIAIIRIEQLYPFPYEELKTTLAAYVHANTLVWCQEEPKNQGAWFCTRHRLLKCLPAPWNLEYVGRRSMAAPAAGYPALHAQLQSELVNRALKIKET